ncbi:MAG: hypothetical protein VB144_12175 [Clostridia bacterium]|nr:hypothetical protein [Clostridia bacterium]
MNIRNKPRLLLSLLPATIILFVPAVFAAGAAGATGRDLDPDPGPFSCCAGAAEGRSAR